MNRAGSSGLRALRSAAIGASFLFAAEGGQVKEYFHLEDPQTGNPIPLKTGFTTREITPAPRTKAPTAARPSGAAEATGQAADAGRTAGSPLARTWSIKASAPLAPDLNSRRIVASGDRVFLLGENFWALFDSGLKSVAVEIRSEPIRIVAPECGAPALDSKRKIFYAPGSDGSLAAFNQSDGKEAFRLEFGYNRNSHLPLIHRFDNRFLLAALEPWPATHHAGYEPSLAAVEVRELEKPGNPGTGDGAAAPSRRAALLLRNSKLLLAGLHGEKVLLVYPNAYYIADKDLAVKAGFTGDFHPVALSIDEGGLLHLVVKTPASTASLWVLDHEGGLLVDCPLESEWGEVWQAPVIGYDHAIYLRFREHLAAFSPLGKRLWVKKFPGLSGVSVTQDGSLLFYAGSDLTALGPDGKTTALMRLPEEYLATPPIFTPDGDLLVAGNRRIFRLGGKKGG